MRHLSALTLACTAGAAFASGLPPALSDAQLRGEATFRFLGIPLYDARLYMRTADPADWSAPFGLELTYRTELSQRELVNSTLQEMRRIGVPLIAREDRSRCFKDVQRGDRFLALVDGTDRLDFLFNGKTTCALREPDVARRFMEIFLGSNTRSPDFTHRLKGMQ